MDDIKPKFIMLVGLPGSGKSTYYENNFSFDNNFVCLSTDNYLEEWAKEHNKTYNDAFNEVYSDAAANLQMKKQNAIKMNKSIILDQTNTSKKSRVKKLKSIPEHYEKIAIYFNISEQTIIDRLKTREELTGKKIPFHVVQEMLMSMSWPEIDEGFDKIIEITENQTTEEDYWGFI